MKIVIHCDPDDANDANLAAAVNRVRNRGSVGGTHGIHVQSQSEALIVFDADDNGCFVTGRSMTVCQLQRHPGAELEYHS